MYLCNNEGQWEDQGTGYIAIVKGPAGRYSIVMRSEAENGGQVTVVLNTPLSMNDIYELQGDTLIVWEDPFMSHHLALSFQSAACCNATIEAMKSIQQGQVDTDDENEDEITIPEPEITSLATLHDILGRLSISPLHTRRVFAGKMAKNGFLEKLFRIFDQCEDLDDTDSLHLLFRIFLSIIRFNDLNLLNCMFDPKFIMKLMGVLEYDPIFQRRLNHREYLQNVVQFHEVVQLKAELRAEIHATFKIQYFKDTVVTRYLDDGTSATLNGLVINKQTEIISELCRDDETMDSIVKQLTEGGTQEKIKVLRLVQEMQTLAKSLLPQGKAEFLAALCANGILRTITDLMLALDPEVRRLAIDIVSQSTQHEPGVLRGFIVDEEEKGQSCPLLQNVILRLVADSPDSERVEMVEILKQLLETGPRAATLVPERAVVTAPEEMGHLLETFYEICIPIAIKPLLQEPDATIASAFHLIDLLAFCVLQHGDFAKGVVLQHGLIGRATALLLSPFCTMHLAAALARFLKAVVTTKDDAFCRQLIQANTFKVLVDLLLRHHDRYNLLYSTILATFEVIRRENIKLLVGHIVENFAATLQPILHLDTVNSLKRQWELMKDKDKALVMELLQRGFDEDLPRELPPRDPAPAEDAPPVSPVTLVAYSEEEDPETQAAKKRKVTEATVT